MKKLPHSDAPEDKAETATEPILCLPKLLPREEWVAAAEMARRINPQNLPERRMLIPRFDETPERIAVLTTRYWSKNTEVLTVGFMDNPLAELRKKILSHMNAWNKSINLRFRFSVSEPQVRIARIPNRGHWSYVGTDVLRIPKELPTMNLDSFTIETHDSEFRRVVRHETGHTLGCWHEHLRKELVELIDPEKAIVYYQRTQGWNRAEVLKQVLTPIEESSLIGTKHTEQDSIMCYHIPGSITRNGEPIVGGQDITKSDYAFMGSIYPKSNDRLKNSQRKSDTKK
ncbi:MAG TPA: M12 family metallopeptidase [Pyrinomonadaceae bacterium]